MLKEGNKITMHFVNHWMHKEPTEEKTNATGVVFIVKKENGKLGFDGNINQSPCTCNGELFTPFSAYSWSVIFKEIETGRLYRFSSIKKELEEVTGLKDGYVGKIKFL